MYKNKYIPTISSLYVNYIFQGIATIIVSQNMSILRENWGASISQITLVISAIGLGRILSINAAGVISDGLGRRRAVLFGIVSYIIFFLGLLLASNYIVAFIISIFAGFGNAFLDTSTYPVVIEAFENRNNNSALSVLNKAFISMGQFLFPIITSFILRNGHYFGWTFIVSAICLLLNLVVSLKVPFPAVEKKPEVKVQAASVEAHCTVCHKQSNVKVELVALLVFSFVSVSLFNTYITWIPSFAQQAIGMAESDSLVLVSAYSIFSFISVFFTSFIVHRGINVPMFMNCCTTLTGLALWLMIVMPNLYTVMLSTFIVGFFAAGGIWQLGLAILLEFFPFKRGLITSYYSLATSIAVMGIPYLTGILAEHHLNNVFILIIGLAFLGSVCLVIVQKRYSRFVYF
ncbi:MULTISPECIES: MFS transporter [unclassified Streptococcus]|uniref:MFS transporter n=1 Tax=unclassified Streptococcus TaxID=2608887 RepID=UPI001071AB87|nr:MULTISPECIES: MFS transporter [unclassified Streptococcus]MBF0786897.1 MFS transporter [Streptococcus sp. 19428wC2_LYSM12]MCQ9212691.1 MFS transporter [Streptococcus sp. B01]MCQ9214032.1 MFS transporter [Streptococcus sp. O1]TFV06265.1 MFS transporter [Streptococcus sp. LYSM12]